VELDDFCHSHPPMDVKEECNRLSIRNLLIRNKVSIRIAPQLQQNGEASAERPGRIGTDASEM
jgi:hypothetical protein